MPVNQLQKQVGVRFFSMGYYSLVGFGILAKKNRLVMKWLRFLLGSVQQRESSSGGRGTESFLPGTDFHSHKLSILIFFYFNVPFQVTIGGLRCLRGVEKTTQGTLICHFLTNRGPLSLVKNIKICYSDQAPNASFRIQMGQLISDNPQTHKLYNQINLSLIFQK